MPDIANGSHGYRRPAHRVDIPAPLVARPVPTPPLPAARHLFPFLAISVTILALGMRPAIATTRHASFPRPAGNP